MLHAQGLVVTLGRKHALDGLDLDIAAGTVYVLLGGNGAGKTTTINAMLGFVQPSSGRVRVDGLCPTLQAEDVRRRLAYLPENVALYPYFSGVENFRYFSTLAGLRVSAHDARCALLAAGLPAEAMARRVAGYSKGMRQKVGLAIAHAKQAKALLLDEPTSGLDPAAALDLVARVRACAATGMAVLMVTHDLVHALKVADRIGVLQQGRLVSEVQPGTVDHAQLERLYLAHEHNAEA